jgi:hypothetical protein
MRESVVFGKPSPGRQARGRRRGPRRNGRDSDDLREEREWPSFGERDGHTRRGDPRPHKGGKHGCDRVRGQGTRRRID